MSETQIFLLGALATALVSLHLGIHWVQFRKMDRESRRMTRRAREERQKTMQPGSTTGSPDAS